MTDIEALRARMRELADEAMLAPHLGHHAEKLRDAAMDKFQALASPANVKALDAEITRLRDDLDRVTRERDEALAYVKDATVAITELTSGGSEFFGKRIAGIYTADLPFCVQRIRETRAGQFEHIRKLARELKSTEAALAKRDEEVAVWRAKYREAVDAVNRATDREIDEALNPDTLRHGNKRFKPKEPTNAEC